MFGTRRIHYKHSKSPRQQEQINELQDSVEELQTLSNQHNRVLRFLEDGLNGV